MLGSAALQSETGRWGGHAERLEMAVPAGDVDAMRSQTIDAKTRAAEELKRGLAHAIGATDCVRSGNASMETQIETLRKIEEDMAAINENVARARRELRYMVRQLMKDKCVLLLAVAMLFCIAGIIAAIAYRRVRKN